MRRELDRKVRLFLGKAIGMGQEKPVGWRLHRKLKVYVGESRRCWTRATGFARSRVGWAAGLAKGHRTLSDQLLGVPFAGTKHETLFSHPLGPAQRSYAAVFHEIANPQTSNLPPRPEPLAGRRRVRKTANLRLTTLRIPHRPRIPSPAH